MADKFVMWMQNGLIPELTSLLIKAGYDPDSSEILKQAKEITEIELRRYRGLEKLKRDVRALAIHGVSGTYVYECKVCGKPFGDNLSLFYHYDEEHNK